jgi:hypothetical protein
MKQLATETAKEMELRQQLAKEQEAASSKPPTQHKAQVSKSKLEKEVERLQAEIERLRKQQS